MRLSNLLLLSCTLVLLLACQGQQREIVHERVEVQVPVPGEPGNFDSQAEGGTDSGGGNGHSGRLLESYSMRVSELSVYKDKIFPIVQNLSQTFPQLSSDLLHLSNERKWYFIPGNLAAIPSSRLGVSLKTDQLALQNRGEIWLNDLLFKELASDDERAKLILHELVMGVKLMEYQDPLDECLSQIALYRLSTSLKSFYENKRKECHRKIPPLPGINGESSIWNQKMDLSQSDYIAIRGLVSTLWETQGKVNGEELKALMKIRGLRSY